MESLPDRTVVGVLNGEPTKHIFNTERMGVAILDDDNEEEKRDIHNIAPEKYEIEHLEEYDKPLLIKIVRWLDERNTNLSKQIFKASDKVVEL